MNYLLPIVILSIALIGCKTEQKKVPNTDILEFPEITKPINPMDTIPLTNGFDFPVGKPDAKGYYNAQKFTVNNHLGEDWNGTKGGNSDLGDPIYAIANGYATFAENCNGGWGNVVRITHKISKDNHIESLYAHCDTLLIKAGDYVTKGQKIATIGNNNGQYLAHLHFELRDKLGMPIGGGYSADTTGFLNPTAFIGKNRK